MKASDGSIADTFAAADAKLIKSIITLVPAANQHDVVEALKQDYPQRYKAVVGVAPGEAWSGATKLASRVKAVALLWLIYFVALPLSLSVLCVRAAMARLFGRPASTNGAGHNGQQTNGHRSSPRGTALVSGGNKTKALHVCRHLHNAGWRVVLVDGSKNWSCCARFSNSVAKFYAVPIPNERPLEYLKAMARIGARENVSLFVPVSIAQYSIYEALAAELLPPGCHNCTLTAPDVAVLNDKIKFQRFCVKHGLTTPHVFPITCKDELRKLNDRPEAFNGKPYLLKSVQYAALSRADMFKLPCNPEKLERYIADLDISDTSPWLLQQFINGPEYACYSIVHDGNIVAHCDNEAELSCLNYAHIGLPEILKWVQKCCTAHPMSGQLCFDFMLDRGEGVLYCIECNPRTSTNILAFQGDQRLPVAFFNPQAVVDSCAAPLEPLLTSRPTYWLFNELGGFLFGDLPAVRGPSQLISGLKTRLHTLLIGTDAVADADDYGPFFALHFLQIPVQLARIIASGKPWIKIDLCSGKVVELGGD